MLQRVICVSMFLFLGGSRRRGSVLADLGENCGGPERISCRREFICDHGSCVTDHRAGSGIPGMTWGDEGSLWTAWTASLGEEQAGGN